MNRRIAFASAVVLSVAVTTAAALPSSVAGDGPDDDHQTLFLLTEQTDERFVSREGRELFAGGEEGPLELRAVLSGENELDSDTLEPGAGAPGGSGTASISLSGGPGASVCWEIEAANITLPAGAAHIHEGAADVNGPVVVSLSPPDTTGLSAGCTDADPALVDAIAADPAGYYVNVHTADFPAGAVRGQLAFALPGDRFFFRENVFLSDEADLKGAQVGHLVAQCTVGIGDSLQCAGAAVIDGLGQVQLMATIENLLTGPGGPFDVAIVGGTGVFRDVGGDVTVTELEPTPEGVAVSHWELRLLHVDEVPELGID